MVQNPVRFSTGYVKAIMVVVGDDATRTERQAVAWQQSSTETLKVRTTASTDAEVLGLVSGEDDLTVVMSQQTDG